MERTDYFEDLIAQIEEKYAKYEDENEEEEMDEEEDRFLRKVNPTQDDILMELNRINPILENKIREEGFGWVFAFTKKFKEEEIVWLDTDQMENMWKSSYYYVSPVLNLMQQPAKYVNSRRDILKERIRSLPTIKWVYRNETLGFEVMDGRHRLANWRDMGIEKVPVKVERES
jgi:hypothetical protein